MPDGAASPPKTAASRRPITLAMIGGGAVILAAGLWFLRLPIGDAAIRAILAGRGVASDFTLVSLDFGGAVLSDVKLGSKQTPDAAAERVEARLAWRGLAPNLTSLHLTHPTLHARLDEAGHLSLGELDRLATGEGGAGGKLKLPSMRLTIDHGSATLDAPMGPIHAVFASDGVIGKDFEGRIEIAPTQLRRGAYAVDLAASHLNFTSDGYASYAHLQIDIATAQWGALTLQGAGLVGTFQAPRDLSAARASLNASVANIAQGENTSTALTFDSSASARLANAGLAQSQWDASAQLNAGQARLAGATLESPQIRARISGAGASGRGDWTLQAENFSGFSLTSQAPRATGALILTEHHPLRVEVQAQLAQSALTRQGRADLRNAIPDLGGSPLAPTLASLKTGLDHAAESFDLTIPLAATFQNQSGRLDLSGPIEARAATGATIRATSLRDGQPGFALAWPQPRLTGALKIETQGGGLPQADLALSRLAWTQNGGVGANGALTITDWRSSGASVTAHDLAFTLAAPPNEEAQLNLHGPLTATGPIGDGEIRDLALDLDLNVAWRAGWNARPAQTCMPARFTALEIAGLAFQNGVLNLCALGEGPLMATNAQHRLSGGFFLDDLRLAGHMAGEAAQPTRLNAQRIEGRFGGTSDNGRLNITIAAPTLAIQMAPGRLLDLNLRQAAAEARFGGNTWRIDGTFEAGALADPTLPGTISAIAGRWSMAPESNGNAVIRVAAGAARVDAVIPPEGVADRRPLFQPMRLADVEAVLRDGKIDAQGRVLLQDDGRDLATFTAHHDIDAGAGHAELHAENLVFDEHFQPYNLSELARAAAANVRGPAAASADVNWSGDTITGEATIHLNGVSLSAASIPVIEDVRGEVRFDDIFKLTTPPGQELTIGLLNPGVAVRDGRVRFQVLSPERVNLESAEFQFAAGVLSVQPTTITLGADETALELTLHDVDVAALIEQLSIKDLTATGTVEGSFPIQLTRRTAFIHDGVLRASPSGGTIAYTGNAGDQATGAARMAFQALSSFRYDNLSLTLNGDLNGELVSGINFSGRNSAPSVELGQGSPIPGLGNIRIMGVPFAFNVHITAPFRSLADTAAGLSDARAVIEHAITNQNQTPEPEHTQQNQGDRSVDVQVAPLR